MFDFLSMMGNREKREVNRYEDDNMVIDTAEVNDATKPYETAISHKSYNDGDWIIVEDYDNPAEAQQGHEKWVGIMTSDNLPEQLTDIMTSGIAQLLLSIDPDSSVHDRS